MEFRAAVVDLIFNAMTAEMFKGSGRIGKAGVIDFVARCIHS